MENIKFFQSELDLASINFDTKLKFDLINQLSSMGVTVAVAETVTGGLLGHVLSSSQNSHKYFRGGLVCQHQMVGINLCGIKPATIRQYGYTSKEVALEMAAGVKRAMGSDIGVSIVGHTKPPISQTTQLQSQTVFIGTVFKQDEKVKTFSFDGTYESIQSRMVLATLGLLKLWVANTALQPAY
jgi:PncC family amidohydrolase